jgi:hypothetical protein
MCTIGSVASHRHTYKALFYHEILLAIADAFSNEPANVLNVVDCDHSMFSYC